MVSADADSTGTQIEFINHAGFIIRTPTVAVCTDPWLNGTAFNGSWSLCVRSVMTPSDFDKVDFICFSHDHPDHFSAETLMSIPPAIRAKIRILSKSDYSQAMFATCRELGFKSVQPLTQRPTEIAPNFSIASAHFRGGDGWVRYEVGSTNILNTNDCVIANSADAAVIGRWNPSVDILMTKFSYSAWAGNPQDQIYRKALAQSRLEAIGLQARHFKPQIIVPIGNHTYFCHTENHYLNDAINSPADARKFIEEELKTSCALLYPGDCYRIGMPWDSDSRALLYQQHFDSAKTFRGESKKIAAQSIEELQAQGYSYVTKGRPSWQREVNRALQCDIFLLDIGVAVNISTNHALTVSPILYEQCDLAMASDSLSLCLAKPFGLEDVRLGGRMREPRSGGLARCLQYFLGQHIEMD